MDWTKFCAAKAEECERCAEQSAGELEVMLEWLQLARDWREAARTGAAPDGYRALQRANG